MRPKALDAVAAQKEGEKSSDTKSPARQQTQATEEPDAASMTSNSSAPASNGPVATTDGTTEGAPTILPTTTIVAEVAQTVKSAVHTVIAWAETKAESLSAEEDSTGPYTSPATCIPSDLDVIASGILPALPTARQYDGGVDDEKKEVKGTGKSTKTGDVESEKDKEEQDDGAEPKS
ncbi:hypothetical protein ACET3X_007405 [Alternaria dauci]|uniref:Uncharacterized protein n=1 Tax=Alternaria dauci TaxID=48095 RepID=A0ABR3UED0_9PLEO